MRRILPLIAFLVLLSGCGDDAPTDEQQVRDTLASFATAVEERDYQTLCDEVFADELLEKLQQIGLPCEVAMQTSFKDVKSPKLTVGEVTVEETTARAEVKTSAEGQPTSQDTLVLKKLGASWRVTALDAGPAPTPTASP